jgi:hypothetical protein
MIGKLIALLFLDRELAHRAHLKTTSYAQHKALDDFYHEVVSLADDLTEMYQGRTLQLVDIPLLEDNANGTITDVLQKHLDMIEKSRYKAVPKEDTAIQNKIDEIVGLYLSTLYKLTFLH